MMYQKTVMLSVIAAASVAVGGYLYVNANQPASDQATQWQANVHGAEQKEKAGTAVDVRGDVNESFSSIEQLKDNSQLIAEVEIEKADSFQYKHVVFTLSEAKLLPA